MPIQNDAKKLEKMTETLAHGYSYKSTQWDLTNEYQHDSVKKVLKNICILELRTKEALALEGLTNNYYKYYQLFLSTQINTSRKYSIDYNRLESPRQSVHIFQMIGSKML